jgi:hypothetical protein
MMKNYFETQKVNWYNFSPDNIIFKSNNITKKLMPQENVMSYKTKTDRDDQMAKKTGAKMYTNNWGHSYYKATNHVAVHVRLADVKKDYVTANVDFVDMSEKTDSLGGHCMGINVLVYIQSQHEKYEWKKNAQGHWGSVKTSKKSLPDAEGYKIAIGGQGDANPLNFEEHLEILQISEAVKRFLIDRVLPFRDGRLTISDGVLNSHQAGEALLAI